MGPPAGWSGRDHPAFISAFALRDLPVEENGCTKRAKLTELQALRARQKTLRGEFRGIEVGLQSRCADGVLVPCDCPICLDIVDENDLGSASGRPFLVRILRCGHVFHEECLRDALIRCRRRCPKCRGAITEEDRDEPARPGLRVARPSSPAGARPAIRSLRPPGADDAQGERPAAPPRAVPQTRQVVRRYVVSKYVLVPLYVPVYLRPPWLDGGRPRSVTW